MGVLFSFCKVVDWIYGHTTDAYMDHLEQMIDKGSIYVGQSRASLILYTYRKKFIEANFENLTASGHISYTSYPSPNSIRHCSSKL